MASLVGRAAYSLCRSWSSAVAGIWSSVGRSLSSTVFQHMSYSNEELDGRVPSSPSPSPESSSALCSLGYSSVSGKCPPVFLKTLTFGGVRLVCDRNSHPLRKREWFRVHRDSRGPPIVILKSQLTWTALNEKESPLGNCLHASGNVSHQLCHDTPVVSGQKLPSGADCGRGNIHKLSARTPSEAVAILRHRQQQGLDIDPFMFVDSLKLCSKERDLTAARQLHDCIIHSGMDKHSYVAITLLNVYIRCRRLDDARRVFDGLEKTKRNVVTWTVIIGEVAKSGRGLEAYRLFLQMNQEGFIPDAITYLSILNSAATSAGALHWVKDVHNHAVAAGLESDVRVSNAIVHMYARSGSIGDAREVFDRLKTRDVTTWSTMIGAYAKSGCGEEAYRLFLQMKREGFKPNAITYLSILNASASAGALEWVKEVHSHALEAELESDVRVGNALVHMYAKSVSIGEARVVFDRLKKRDLTTWNTMIGAYAESGCGVEAYRLFLQMKREGYKPDAITCLSILNASASAGALKWVKEVHTHAVEAGLESDLRVSNALVRMYAKSGSVGDARVVFDRLKTRDVTTWTIMIGAYAEGGCGEEAYRLFLQMKQEGFIPDAVTYLSILNAAASAGALEWVKDVHKHAVEAGIESDLRVSNALVHMYARSGSLGDARLVFDRLKIRDVTTWSTMIGAYAKSGCGEEAYRLFLEMKRERFKPNAITYLSILNASASAGALEWVKEVHRDAVEAGLESDLRVGNALARMYAKSGSMSDALVVFDRMKTRDVSTWNIVIGAYAESGCGLEAYRVFLQMEKEGFVPDAITYLSILNSSASAGALEWVKGVHNHAVEAGPELDLRVSNALIHMYAKSGSIRDARVVFDNMKNRDVVTFNIMMGGLAQHGRGHEALELFRKMDSNCVKANGISFLAVLSACCHAGLLDDGRRLFLAMTRDYGIEPAVEHYTCIVDLLGRAGHMEEARHLIGDMPVEPNDVTWQALLGACRTHGNVELGELAAEALLKLQPKNASAYVLLSNIYAAAGKWEKVSLVRSIMEDRGIRKEPGRSRIEVGNKIHDFIVGDTSHPEAEAIYNVLKNLTEKLKAEGYIPDTKLVLQNIDEGDKELALCSHSEKVAIAYGLLRIPRGKPIVIFKNLRVCSDCHTATKFISKVTGRVIIARDASRFHHFKDGVCSCGDYW